MVNYIKKRYNLEERRIALGMTQAEFSEICIISKSAYSNIERGKTNPHKFTKNLIMCVVVKNGEISEEDLFKLETKIVNTFPYNHTLFECDRKSNCGLKVTSSLRNHKIEHIRRKY